MIQASQEAEKITQSPVFGPYIPRPLKHCVEKGKFTLCKWVFIVSVSIKIVNVMIVFIFRIDIMIHVHV